MMQSYCIKPVTQRIDVSLVFYANNINCTILNSASTLLINMYIYDKKSPSVIK